MNTVQRIAKNSGVLLVSQIASYVFGFFFVMYTARYLGAEGFGVLSFALAFTGIFGIFGDLGLSTLAVREVARDKSLAGKYLGNIIAMKVVLVVITFGMIFLAINILGYPEQTVKVVYLLGLYVILGSLSNAFSSIFQAFEKMEYVSIGAILNSALMLVGALFAISRGFDVAGFASIYLVVSIIILGYNSFICITKFVLPKIEVDWGFWKPTMREALPFGLSGIFIMIYYWIDSVMLSIMIGNEVVGWYNAAYRLVLVLLSIYTAYITSIFPIMSKFYHETTGDSLKIVYAMSFRYLVVVSIPIAIGTTLLADRIILLIYGIEYIPSIIALQVLIWTIVFMFLSGLSANLFASINRQIIITKITGIGAAVNILLNLLVIPRFGYIGASITTVATELTVLCILIYILSNTEYKNQMVSKKDILKIMLSTLPMIIIIIINKFIYINLIILILLCAFVYFSTIYTLKVLNKDDISMMKSLYIREKQSHITGKRCLK